MESNALQYKHHFVAMVGEYIGTTMFLFMGLAAAQIANLPAATVTIPGDTAFVNTASLLFIAFAFGVSLVINVWVFFRVSGALFNPVISLALAVAGIIPPLRAILLVVSQVLGGITAAALIHGLTPGPLNVGNRLGDGVSIARGLFYEMFLTAQLVLVVFMVAVEKHKSTFLAPLAIGLTLFTAHLAGIHFTGASLNPARSFGPDLVTGNFPEYHWIYWLGPSFGALLSTGVYKMLKFLRYEEVCGTEDRDDTMLVARVETSDHYKFPSSNQDIELPTLRNQRNRNNRSDSRKSEESV